MGYKGYLGNVEFSEEDEMFFGRGLGIRSLISYESKRTYWKGLNTNGK